MNVERFKPNGYKDTTHGISPAAADRIYAAHIPMVRTPFSKYYRVVVTDPQAGGRIIRDTDHEFFGHSASQDYYRRNGEPSQTMSPR